MARRMCVRCIMDTTDPAIRFDTQGICNHCHRYDELSRRRSLTGEEGRRRLDGIVAQMRQRGVGREYDCVLGLSGGVDSTFLAVQAKRLGLRPLAVHFDSGWDSELAVHNIENVVKKLEIDLFTWVVDWEEMRDLQVAFLRAGVANADIPTDHALVASLYRVAADKGVQYILSGTNVVTEAVIPTAWGYNSSDVRHLRAIHRRFGTAALRHYPQMGFSQRYLWYRLVKGIKIVRMLDFMPYVKSEAMRSLESELGWRSYGGKHHESIFTRFYQSYYLVRRFGFDKRRAHLSNLVCSGQMERENALREMEGEPCPLDEAKFLREYVLKKLRLTEQQFEEIMEEPLRSYREYPSSEWLYRMKDAVGPWLQRWGVSP